MDWPLWWDSWLSLWNLWWVKHAIMEHQTNPFHTDHLFFPQGSDLYLHTLGTVSGVLSIPLQLVTNNLFLSWNVLLLLSFVLSALGMYAVSYRVTANHASALISGYIFAFAPYIFTKTLSHWHLAVTWPIPLLVLFVMRFQETGRLREAVAAGIFWALLTYNSLEYGVWAALFLGLFLAYWSIVYLRQRDWLRLPALWLGCAVLGGVWFAVTAPMLIPALQSIYSGDYGLTVGGEPEYYSADLLGFVTPSPLWGPGTVPEVNLPDKAGIGAWETTVYLGILPLLLAGLALFAVRRTPHRVVFWAVVFLFFAMLALGPYLYVGNTKSLSLLGASFTIPLPYQIYDQLPVVGVARVPGRMIVFGFVGLAVLAGTGFDVLTSWFRRKYKLLAPLAALAVLSLVVVEYWNPPVQLSLLTAPAIFEEIRDEPGHFAVLDAPWGRLTGTTGSGHRTGAALTSYYQSIHGKPSFGGFLARAKQSALNWVGEEPGLHYLACLCKDREDDMDPDLVRGVFRQYRIKYVVLHRLDPNGTVIISDEDLLDVDEYLRTVVGLRPIFSDSSFTVYRNQGVE